jgi:hypothetical protein
MRSLQSQRPRRAIEGHTLSNMFGTQKKRLADLSCQPFVLIG